MTTTTNTTEVSALHYAATKLRFSKKFQKAEPILSVAAMALYVHFKDRKQVFYHDLLPYLREYPLTDPSTSARIQGEEKFGTIEKMVSYLRNDTKLKEDVLLELTQDKQGMAWIEPPETPTNVMKTMVDQMGYPYDKATDYLQYAVDAYVYSPEFYAAGRDEKENPSLFENGFDNKSAKECINIICKDNLARHSALNYFGMIAYASRHKTIDLQVNLADVTMYAQALKLEEETRAREALAQQEAQDKVDRKIRRIGIPVSIIALGGLIGYGIWDKQQEKKAEEFLKNKEKVIELTDDKKRDTLQQDNTKTNKPIAVPADAVHYTP